MKSRNPIAKTLPEYKHKVIEDKRQKEAEKEATIEIKTQELEYEFYK